MFLTTLRYLLVQDWDLDDDGRPETLRLLDAIPPRWLADGQTLAAERHADGVRRAVVSGPVAARATSG